MGSWSESAFFHETGELAAERPLKNGVLHGIAYRSDIPGKLLSAEPYFNGLPHGTAKQWSDDGKLLGTYTMRHGTGITTVGSPICRKLATSRVGNGTRSIGGLTRIRRASGRSAISGTTSCTASSDQRIMKRQYLREETALTESSRRWA